MDENLYGPYFYFYQGHGFDERRGEIIRKALKNIYLGLSIRSFYVWFPGPMAKSTTFRV